jgi:DNA polymerase-4
MNTILHVDMDAFYAAIEQRDRPELRGKPVIVGGSPASRGVVCAASYEARVFGVHSAMPAAMAHRLCRDGVFLPPRMSYYATVGRQIRAILSDFTPLVEPLSLDEAFLDVRGCTELFGPALHIAQHIRTRIRRELDLVASVGVAPNKFLAKLASDMSKPDGLVEIEPERVAEVLAPLPVSRVWGVGARAEQRLRLLGIQTIGQLAAFPEKILREHLGKWGTHLHHLAQGRDERPVIPDEDARSVSTETTFAHDIGDRQVLRAWLLELVEQLGQRLRHVQARARTLDLKIRSADFQTFHRSVTLGEPTDVTEVLWKGFVDLFDHRVPGPWLPIRLLGVGAAGLVRGPHRQGNLFDDGWQHRQRTLDQTVDRIRELFGRDAMRRAAGVEARE